MGEEEGTSTGLPENIAGFLCYLLFFVTGILFLIVERKNQVVRFHAMQSTLTFLSLFIIFVILSWISILNFIPIPYISVVLNPITILFFGLILWLFLMVKAFQGKQYMLPMVGRIAEDRLIGSEEPDLINEFSMRQKSKKKIKRNKIKRNKNKMKVLLLLMVVGTGLLFFSLFYQKIFNSLTPWLEQWGVLGERKVVSLYFSDDEGEYLIGEKREILKRNRVEEEAKETLLWLIKGPKGKLISTLPPRTELLTLQLDEQGVATVNFSHALSGDHPGGSSAEMITVYSIVNSLTLNFPEIKRVQFLVEGKAIETIAGHLSLKQPLSSNPDLIKEIKKKRDND